MAAAAAAAEGSEGGREVPPRCISVTVTSFKTIVSSATTRLPLTTPRSVNCKIICFKLLMLKQDSKLVSALKD